MSDHIDKFFSELSAVLAEPHVAASVDSIVDELVELRDRGGRLFCLGVGGGAANAAHAVCDFRKLCGIEAYAPSDSTAELTARVNDEGWATVFAAWLRGSRLELRDTVFVFSVGGGMPDVSVCIYEAVVYAREVGARILGVVALPSGATALLGHAVVITSLTPKFRTPLTEALQGVVHHAVVSDPRLQVNATKW